MLFVLRHTPPEPRGGLRARGQAARAESGLDKQARELADAQSWQGRRPSPIPQRKALDLHGDTRQKEVCKYSLSGEQGLIEESGRADAQSPRLKVAPLVEEQQRLIQIQKPGPHQVFFFREHVAGLGEPLERVNRFPLLA